MLTITSLLLVLLLTFHMSGDIVYGWEPGGVANLVGTVLISVVWLYGTLVLFERRSGNHHLLLSALFIGRPVHSHEGERCRLRHTASHTSRHVFFRLTLLAIACSSLLRHPLSARLWTALAPAR